jgi:murein DD-endopeptidase MepM/ murein hydrolase activator NlpD
MKSASKWAAITALASITFLSGATAPTSAENLAASPGPASTWLSPLPGIRPIITSYHPQGKRGSQKRGAHMGVDFIATFGEEIRAPIAGVISYSGTINEIPIVVLTHQDPLVLRRTTYLPATTDFLVGSYIAQGENFARVAPIFHCARPCLHWGERIGTKYANPMKHLGRARLLPRFL